jgi:hypothetical protein
LAATSIQLKPHQRRSVCIAFAAQADVACANQQAFAAAQGHCVGLAVDNFFIRYIGMVQSLV